MKNDTEIIILEFSPKEKDITWKKREADRKSKIKSNSKVDTTENSKNLKLTSTPKVKVDCKYCNEMIEKTEYANHLLTVHHIEQKKNDSEESTCSNEDVNNKKKYKKETNTKKKMKIIWRYSL